MLKTSKNNKLAFISILLVIVCGFIFCSTNFFQSKQMAEIQTIERTIEINRTAVDYQSILDEFEDSELETKGTLTTFVGYKSIDLAELDGIDLVSDTDISDTKVNVKYNFSYDKETNIVTLSAELKDELGETHIDTITGAAFINEDGEIDAVMNVDDEGILLSEMKNAGMIDNCGWFKRLIKKVVKVVAVVAVVSVVAAATAAVVVATAGAAAPALVAAGVGVTTSTAVGLAAGATAGALFAATIGMSAIKAGTAFAEKLADGVEQVVDKVTGKVICLILSGIEFATIAYVESSIKDLKVNEYKFVAQDAGNGKEPRYHVKHNLDKSGNLKFGIYFDHYHPFLNAVTIDALGFEIPVGHAFFGVASINI